jgi:hypothetical protein
MQWKDPVNERIVQRLIAEVGVNRAELNANPGQWALIGTVRRESDVAAVRTVYGEQFYAFEIDPVYAGGDSARVVSPARRPTPVAWEIYAKRMVG